MSTYINGVTDYLPQIQSFRPDFNFFGGALGMKQGQYDESHNQLSNLYGSLLNSPMMRDQNIKARDDYFKAINGEIKKVANLDLSKKQNVQAASTLFNGLYDNKNIVKDMVWTKNYQNEVQRGEGFRNCVDPEKCGGSYWEGGMKALNYKAQEFRNATDEQAMNFGNVRYTPYQNVMEKAIKAANDAGLSISVDQLQGRYITTTKNGPMLIDPLNSLFTGLFGNDPAIMEFYETQAYVNRKDWVQSNVPVYGDEAAAESAYIQQISGGMTSMFNQAKEDVDARSNNISGQKRQIEEKIRREGTTSGSSLANQYRELNNLEGQIGASKESIDNAYGTYQNALDPAMRAQMGENIDKAMASYLLAGDIGSAAQTLAYKDYEFSMKADPYALENVKQSNRMQLESMKFGNQKLLAKYKYDLEHWEEKLATQGNEIDNIPIVKRIIEGGADINLEEGQAHKMFKDKQGNLQLDISGGEKNILKEMINLTLNKSKTENGQGIATDDLVKLGDLFFSEMSSNDAKFYTEGEFISNKQMSMQNKRTKDKWDKMSYKQKVNFMQTQDYDKLVANRGFSGTVIDNVYSEFALPLLDQKNDFNRTNRDYLGNLWATSGAIRNDIEVKNHLLQDMGEWYGKESQKVIQNMKASEEFAGFASAFEFYIDPTTGAKRSASEFAASMAEASLELGSDLTYDEIFQNAIDLYNNDLVIESQNSLLVPDHELDLDMDAIWAQAFSKYMDPAGGAIALGLVGSDSNAAMGLQFPSVDPAKFASAGTMNTISFMQDVFSAGEEGARLQLGGPSSELPSGSDVALQGLFNQLYSDMLNKKKSTDDSRPILNVTYQDIAGSDDQWTALNVKLNSPYVRDFLGSENAPGLTRGIDQELVSEGFTIYLDKGAAQNGFRKGVEKSPIEQTMHYTGQYAFDAYPEYSKDLSLTRDAGGGYVLSGNVMGGLDENGEPKWQPVYVPYNSLGTDPTLVVQEVNAWLDEVARGNKFQMTQYNNANGIKDPALLLNQ